MHLLFLHLRNADRLLYIQYTQIEQCRITIIIIHSLCGVVDIESALYIQYVDGMFLHTKHWVLYIDITA